MDVMSIVRELWLMVKAVGVLIRDNIPIALVGGGVVSLFTINKDVKKTAALVNTQRIAYTAGTSVASSISATAVVAYDQYAQKGIEERLQKKYEQYQTTVGFVDSLSDEQLARICEQIDARIQEESGYLAADRQETENNGVIRM